MATTKGPYAEAVDTFFDRLGELYPVYVSPVRATVVSLVVSAAALALLAPALHFHLGRLRDPAATAPEHMASAGVVLGGAAGVVALGSTLRDVLYRRDLFGANKLHFALEYWVTRYVRAARDGATGLLPP
jgi:hypothetical protein